MSLENEKLPEKEEIEAQNGVDVDEELGTKTFDELLISQQTKDAISKLKFTKMMPIQEKAIPIILDGNDILAAAKTGSGKTLAFLIPAIEFLFKNNIKQEDGTKVLIIAPTRELALQTYEVAEKLLDGSGITCTCIYGGNQKKSETQILKAGVNLLVATPGRLVDHMLTTKEWSLNNMKMLIIDEADRILEDGFSDQLHEIISEVPKERQTLLFSATQTQDIKKLAEISFKKEPIYIGVDDNADEVTAANLDQDCFIVPADKTLLLLVTLLSRSKGKKKIMVFFNTRAGVKFHSAYMKYLNIGTLCIHGDQSQTKRIETFNKFRSQKFGTLLCTDVAARGLDIRGVDWVVQYDPPQSVKEYIHRVGRAARAGASGKALIILHENERKFIEHLHNAKVPIKEQKFPEKKLLNIKNVMQNALLEDRKLQKGAKEALKAYLMGYESHPMQDCFNITKLDILGVALSYGFSEMPQLDIPLSSGKTSDAPWIQKEKKKHGK